MHICSCVCQYSTLLCSKVSVVSVESHALVKHPCVVLTHQHLHYQPLNLLQEPLEGPASKFVEIDLFPWKSPLCSCTFSEFSNFGCVACCADWLRFHPVYLCHLTDNSGKKLAKIHHSCVYLWQVSSAKVVVSSRVPSRCSDLPVTTSADYFI